MTEVKQNKTKPFTDAAAKDTKQSLPCLLGMEKFSLSCILP
jgi:hypothetical protein